MSPELIDILKTGGTTLLLGYMWWSERQERIKERNRNEALAKEMITAMVKTDDTLRTIGGIFSALGKPSA